MFHIDSKSDKNSKRVVENMLFIYLKQRSPSTKRIIDEEKAKCLNVCAAVAERLFLKNVKNGNKYLSLVNKTMLYTIYMN